ncbi:hypothetical protein LRH25_31430 [Ideonella azotifigens]|uniref:Uncharacterized protein n=2 Tax=Ideonella azotifigens TaxID=513160 RepID=A0ABN1K040_9BURK|nr:hypothetical protein [Ideonella azotifigens]MCD2344837.1 hypothetical protein [Ideonella azotifigens]
MTGATASLPDLGPALDAATNAQTGLSSFMDVAGSLASGDSGSPLGAVTQAFGGVQGALDIDVSGLSEALPKAISTIQNALPGDALAFIENLNESYQGLSDFLANSPLVQQIHPGDSLEQTALKLIEAVLSAFSDRLAELGSTLIDTDTLAQVTAALGTIEQLAGGQVPSADDLLNFLAQQLVGVDHDLLAGASQHLDGALALIQPLTAGGIEGLIGTVRDQAALSFQALANAIVSFDAADAAAYAALEALLQAWSDALGLAFDAIDAGCDALTALVADDAWDTLFSAYATVLGAVPLVELPSVDDAVDAIASVIESLLSRLRMSLSPQDLAAQIARASNGVHEMFAASPLSQVQQILIDFIGKIQQAMADVPTEQVQLAVSGMLSRVKQELDALHIDQVRTGIAEGFQAAHDFIEQNIGDDLLGDLSSTLADALDQFKQIPIADVADAIGDVVQQAGSLIQQLASDLSSALDDLKALLAQLDGLDFKPVADEVIDEIDALKAKLSAIKPESLSEPEKIAIQGGLALLRAVDLEGMIETQLKTGFKTIDDELAEAVQAVLDAWNNFRDRIIGFDGSAILAPVNALLDQVEKSVNGINATLVLAPLDGLVDELVAQADKLSPGQLLEPLKAPYQQMMAAINRASPDVWVEPLRLLHTEIDRLVDLIDITPLLDTLEQKERELFTQARDGLASALDSVHLPPPLDTFFETMKALMLGLADAVFGDPDGALRQYNLTLGDSVKPSSLFKPLDLVFDQLMAAVDKLPVADVASALEAIRTGLGMALPALNPAQVTRLLREAQQRVDALSPSALAGAVTLPALRVRLDAQIALSAGNGAAKASLSAKFDLVLAPLKLDVPSSRLQQLDGRVRELSAALRQRINGLDASGAQAAYNRLNSGLAKMLPAFLTQPQPITADTLHGALATLRPSTKARRIDLAVDRFLGDLAPLQAALDDAVNGFFGEIRQAALVLHPAGLKTAVSGVYDTLRAKLNILDPDALAAELKTTVWDPLMDPLKAIDPAAIQVQLDALYQQLVAKITGSLRGMLTQLKQAIDGFLNQVRAELKKVLDALKAQLEAILADVTALLQQVDQLIVHDLLERLLTLLANLQTSFDQQLDRVLNEFDTMLNAIPLGAPSQSSALAL